MPNLNSDDLEDTFNEWITRLEIYRSRWYTARDFLISAINGDPNALARARVWLKAKEKEDEEEGEP